MILLELRYIVSVKQNPCCRTTYVEYLKPLQEAGNIVSQGIITKIFGNIDILVSFLFPYFTPPSPR